MEDTLWKQSLLGAFWSTFSQVCLKCVQILYFAIIARLLLPYHFGIIAFAMLYFLLLQALFNKGLSLLIIQKSELNVAFINSIFWINTLLGVCITLGTLAVSSLGIWVMGYTDLLRVLIFLSPLALLYALASVPYALLLRHLHQKEIAYASLLSMTASDAVAILLAWTGFGLWSLIAQQLVYAGAVLALLLSFGTWKPQWPCSLRLVQRDLHFAFSSWGDTFVRYWSGSIDQFLVTMFFGPGALGLYSIAYGICTNIFTVFSMTIVNISLPVFSQLQHDPSKMRKALITATPLAYFIAIPISVILLIFSPQLVTFFFGTRWIAAVPLVRIFALLGFITPATVFWDQMIVAIGKPSWNLFFGVSLLITTAISMPIAAQWNVSAVATTKVLISLCFMFPVFALIRRSTHITIGSYFRPLLPMVAAGICMTIVMTFLRMVLPTGDTVSLSLLMISVTGLALYLVVCGFLARNIFSHILRAFA